MAPSSSQPPLPLAANRAALSNRISLLLASQSSVIKSMNLRRPENSSTSSAPSPARAHLDDDDEDGEDLWKGGTRPNEGVGYVRDKAGTAAEDARREDGALRSRLLGKRKGGGGGEAAAVARGKKGLGPGSESDEEEGRSGLGKRKRPRKKAAAGDAEDAVARAGVVPGAQGEDEEEEEAVEADEHEEGAGEERDGELAETVKSTDETQDIGAKTEGRTGKNKKKKKKKKRDKAKAST